MTERVTWITHRGIKILLLDHSNIRWDEEHVKILQTAAKIISTENEVRYLVDFTGCYISGNMVQKGISIMGPKEHKVTRRAFVGVTDYKLSIFTLLKVVAFIRGDSKVFHKQQDALDWLIK